jgi:hypothetical protein
VAGGEVIAVSTVQMPETFPAASRMRRSIWSRVMAVPSAFRKART